MILPDVVFSLIKASRKIVVACVFFMAAYSGVFAQAAIPTTSTETWFDNIVGRENSGIINGPEYKIELQGARSNPFFGTGEVSGIVSYNDRVYVVPLIYDIYKDELVVKHLSGSGRAWFVLLEKRLVKEFVLNEKVFRNYGGERGFQEVLFDGKNLQVLAKHTKTYEVRKGIFNYHDFEKRAIRSGNEWKSFSGTGSFSKILENKLDKSRLKDFLDKNDIGRKPLNAELQQVAAFVDELLNKKAQ